MPIIVSPAEAYRPVAGARYPQLLRTPESAWWRSVAGVLIAIWTWLLLSSLVSQTVLLAAWRIGHQDLGRDEFLAAARGYQYWEGMLASHLGIMTMIPIVLTLLHFLHRVPIRRIWSVDDGLRWRYLLACLLVALGVFGVYIATMPWRGQSLTWQPQTGLLPFLLVILLVTPIQSAAEEIMFRGYLLQGVGGLFRNPWPAVAGSALLFALFHGAQNPQLFLSRFAFGLLAGWLVVRTGGLEAGIAAHVVNNVFAFGLAGLTGSIAQVRQVTEVGWTQAFSDVITFAVVAALASLVALKMRVPDRVDAAG